MKIIESPQWSDVYALVNTWSLSYEQKINILGLSVCSSDEEDIKFVASKTDYSQEHEKRFILLKSINTSLKIVFNNPSNIDRFMTLRNHNKPFNGKMPIDIAIKGINGLESVDIAIASMILV